MRMTILCLTPLISAMLCSNLALAEEKPGYIGIQIRKHEGDKGATIQAVIGDSPAEKAGLKTDDVIIKIDGNEFASLEDLVKKIRACKPGDKLSITIMRDDKEKEIKVTAGTAPETN